MKKELITFYVLLLLMLMPISVQCEELMVEDSKHVTGELQVNGFSFPVDALLEDTSRSGEYVKYKAHDIDTKYIQEQIATFFPEVSPMFQQAWNGIELSVQQDNFQFPSDPYPSVNPYSLALNTQELTSVFQRSKSFCESIGLAVSSVPLSCTYIVYGDSISTFRFSQQYFDQLPSDAIIEVWLLLSTDDGSVIPFFQTSHYNGDLELTGHDNLLTQNPGAQFYYSTDGNLLGMKLSYMDIEKNDTAVEHKLSWESALTLFLNSYTSNSRIQHLLQSGSYTITSIRSAWDMSEINDGTYGWLITLSSTIPAQDSPIGWRNRHYTAFVEDR